MNDKNDQDQDYEPYIFDFRPHLRKFDDTFFGETLQFDLCKDTSVLISEQPQFHNFVSGLLIRLKCRKVHKTFDLGKLVPSNTPLGDDLVSQAHEMLQTEFFEQPPECNPWEQLIRKAQEARNRAWAPFLQTPP